MKALVFIALAAIGFTACQSGDKKIDGPKISPEEVNKIIADSANFTTIAWLDSTYIDLGKVKDGKIVEVSFRFKNTGNKPLVFSSVQAGCGCTVVEKPERAYAPGEEDVIRAKFESKDRKGENRKYIDVMANTDPTSSQRLEFRVEVE